MVLGVMERQFRHKMRHINLFNGLYIGTLKVFYLKVMINNKHMNIIKK